MGHIDKDPLIDHIDRGSQYLAIRKSERPAEAGANHSVGRKGDTYDIDMAESVIRLFKKEIIYPKSPLKNIDVVDYSVLEWGWIGLTT